MNKLLQAKDIDELPILQFLLDLEERDTHLGATWFETLDSETGEHFPNSLYNVLPTTIPTRVLQAKMRSLIKRKLVDGCGCGCRGDYTITELGKEHLNKLNEHRRQT